MSRNEAHGDEDWMDVSDVAIHEAAIEIICDRHQREHEQFLARLNWAKAKAKGSSSEPPAK